MPKTKGPKKQTINIESAHEIHALLDFMLVETAVENKGQAKRLSLPYKTILAPDPKFENVNLVVEIVTYWDVKRSKNEQDNGPEVRSKTATRH